jgi:8-oxo-dGTP pyrophosphatase MutT (NUDIX family)
MNKKNECPKLKRAYMIPVFVHQGNIYIMVMRPSDKKFGGTEYQIAKGRIDPGETSLEAAIRECEEELGLFLPENSAVSLGYYFNNTGEVFYSIVDNSEYQTKPCHETIHTAWLSLSEFMLIGRGIQKHIIMNLGERLNIIENV